MRTHADIIADAGGYQKLAQRLAQPVNRVRFWERRQAIPAEQWKACAEAGVASLEELVEAVTKRRAVAALPRGRAA